MDLNVIFGGTLAGLAQCVVGHPFDTMKVSQVGNIDNINKRKIKYYKGVGAPILSSLLMNVQTFYIYSLFDNKNQNIFISGSITGAILTLTESPFDLIKTRLQTDSNTNYIKIIKEGELLRGFNACLCRNVISNGLYFWSYYKTKDYFNNEYIGSLIGGGVAGLLSWGPVYPIDNIKTRIQTDTTGKYKGIIDSIQKVVKTEGYKGLGHGFVPCIVRAIVVNPFIFLSYEIGSKFFN